MPIPEPWNSILAALFTLVVGLWAAAVTYLNLTRKKVRGESPYTR